MTLVMAWRSQEEETRRLWYATILFIAKGLRATSGGSPGEGTGIVLTQILDVCRVW